MMLSNADAFQKEEIAVHFEDLQIKQFRESDFVFINEF